LPPFAGAVEETWTIGRVIAWTSEFFKRKGLDSPRLTAELLLGSVLSLDRVHLYTDFDRPLQKDELAAFRALVQRRASGEPTHYLLGRREFYGRSFRVDPRVLVPRPETEMLIEAALECLGDHSQARALDLCTGSGCVGVTLAAERPSLRVVATDASLPALEVARENASAHGVADRVELRAGDLFAPVARERFELITANPPYVETSAIEGLSPEVRREPREALDGGPDGLTLIRRLITGAREHLSPGGCLLFEIGDRQGPAVLDLLGTAGFPGASVQKDFAGFDRIARAHRD
jgi:release factor glutamine methyltransferase